MKYIAIVFLFLATTASAHVIGITFENTIGDYLIDIGYNSSVIEAGKEGRFDFTIIDNKTGDLAVYTDVSVRIEQGKTTIFSSTLHRPEFGLPVAILVIPNPGDYELKVRFDNNRDVVAETSFPLKVEKPEDVAKREKRDLIIKILLAPAGLIAGFFLSKFLNRKKA